MPIVHPSKAHNPRDLQVTHSRGSEREARAIAAAITQGGVPCDVHQFPEFNGNWWAVCARRKSQLERGKALASVYTAGAIDALDMHYGRPLQCDAGQPGLHRLG